jgi:hypothetical protein
MQEILLGMLSKLATTGAIAGVKRLLKGTPVVTAIDEAISATTDEFREVEGVSDNLRRWCESEDFVNLLTQFKDGTRAPQPDQVVSSFVTATGFYLGDRTRTHKAARTILEAFARNLGAALHKGDDGILTLAAREEVQHQTTQKMISAVLGANAEEDEGLQRTRYRFAEKVADIYRDLALRLICGGDSIYHQQTLTKDIARAEELGTDDVDRIDIACRGLATDILVRLGTIASLAENARSMLEHLRQSFGYALNPSMSSEFDGMIDALETIVRLAPRHPAFSYSDVKQRARIPRALPDLRAFIIQAEALDVSFRRLFLVASRHSCEEAGVLSESNVRISVDWYRRYYTVLDRLWKGIADCTTLVKDTW